MIVGIDPGMTGAIAIMNVKGIISKYFDMPTLSDGKRRLIDINAVKGFLLENKDIVVIEKAQCMPKNGAVGMFNYGVSYGMILGLCEGLNIPVHTVHPTTWKKAMLKDMPKGKESSIIKVLQLYPHLRLERKKDHGVCDAILLALYGINHIGL